MVEVLLAGILAMVISIVAGPKFIEFLRQNEFGQHIREEGPEGHVVKQGTPTMGGLLIMVSMAVPFLIFSDRTLPALTVFFVTLGCAAIGFVDDWTKLSHRRSLGLAGPLEARLARRITVVVGVVAERGLDYSRRRLPAARRRRPAALLGLVRAPLPHHRRRRQRREPDRRPRRPRGGHGDDRAPHLHGDERRRLARRSAPSAAADQVDLDLAILGASLIGASIGFLWYNAFPAQVFMGDTGSMGLGGALAAFAIMTKTESCSS